MIIHVLAFFLCASLGAELCAATFSGVVPLEFRERFDDEVALINGLYMYDIKGNEIQITQGRELSTNWGGEITFKLYTKQTPTRGHELKTHSATSLENSGFDPSKPTYMITHGWQNNENSSSCVLIRKAYLENSDSNVIVVDWSSYSMSIYYIDVTFKVKEIGERVKRFIEWLYENGLNADDVTLVGHSLGAHVMGMAGYELRPQVNSIVGLDPALPMYNFANESNALSLKDAKHVQIIHTNAGILGYACPHGHSDFFPNGGGEQPGCCDGELSCAACSHARAVDYFAESISKTFNGTKCDTYAHFQTNSCDNDAQVKRMGGLNLETVTYGTYYLRTNSESPFSEVNEVTKLPKSNLIWQYLYNLFKLYMYVSFPTLEVPSLYSLRELLNVDLWSLLVEGGCNYKNLTETLIDEFYDSFAEK